MDKRLIIKILSPLLFFVIHIIYLVFFSQDPFLKKWIDGSFTFFVALVLCNLVRARIVGPSPPEDGGPDGKPETGEDGLAR